MAQKSTEMQTLLGRRHTAAMSQIRWCLSALHLGDYAAVLAQTPATLDVVQNNRAAMSAGRTLFLSGSARLALDDKQASRRELREAADILREIGSRNYLREAR